MSSRMKTVEQKVDQCEAKEEQMEDKQELNLAKQDKVNSVFEERLKKLELNSGSGVIREIDDRMDKLNNLVMHRVPESTSEDPMERSAHDSAIIKVLMEKYLGIKDIDTDNKLRFIRRLGGRGEKEEARPILLGLKFTADLELVLDRSWMLSQCNNTTAQAVNIVRDLTVKQRQREFDMVNEACRKNLDRSGEDVNQNLVYKVVGRKGEKREIKVSLRQGEELDGEGKVIRREGWNRGQRGALNRQLGTGGNSEPLGKDRKETEPVEARTKPTIQKTPEQKKTTKEQRTTCNKGEGAEREEEVRKGKAIKGSGDWEPATGKRGRTSPSPDKVLKRGRAGGVMELKNRFQQMAEGLFRA